MKVVWSREANAQKHDICCFLADHSVRLADRIEARLEARAKSLGSVTMQGSPINGGRRSLSIPDIQHVIVYRIDEDAIRILSVWNMAQDRSE